MAYTRPGRLYRKLKPTLPLFRFTTEIGTYLDDDAITGVTIQRGSASPDGGITPTTLEISLSGFAAIQTGNHCELNLTTTGANLLNELVGASASLVQERFYGRIGKQTVDDRGPRRRTTMLAASWAAQLGKVQKGWAPPVGTNVGDVIAELMTATALPRLSAPVRMAPADQYGSVHEQQSTQTFSDFNRWSTALGITVRETRAGRHQLLTHPWRWQSALDGLGSSVPVIRAQALAPATWEQANGSIPRNQRLTWGSGNGTNSATWGQVDDPTALVVDHDLTHARFNNEAQVRAEGARLRASEWTTSYSIPSVTIDLLHLITSTNQYDRDQASRLLTMQVGDPVYFSGDWPIQLRGIHFATGLTENISGSGWNLTLSLSESHRVVGEISPTVPARVWDSATYPWDDESRTWNTA